MAEGMSQVDPWEEQVYALLHPRIEKQPAPAFGSQNMFKL